MTSPNTIQTSIEKNPVMTQQERSALRGRAIRSAIGGLLFVAIWGVAVITLLSALKSPSAAPPLVFVGIILVLTIGLCFRAYPYLKQASMMWQDLQLGQVDLDEGTVKAIVSRTGRNIELLILVNSSRTYPILNSMLKRIHGEQNDDHYILRIAPKSRIVLNVLALK